MPLSLGDELHFDGFLGRVVAVTATLDADGRGSITYGTDFHFRCLKATVAGTDYPVTTAGTTDPHLRIGLLERELPAAHPDYARRWALVFDHPPKWGRHVGGNKATWYEASAFAAQDSCIFRMGWAPGPLTVRHGGVLQASVYVDFVMEYSTDDGTREAWDQPAYPYAGWVGGPNGKWRTDAEGVVQRIYADGTTEPPIFPRGMGADFHRLQDGWSGSPEPERHLTALHMFYLQESILVVENESATLNVAAVEITVNGPVNAEAELYWEQGIGRAGLSLGAGGTGTATGLPPGRYDVYCYEASSKDKGMAMQTLDAEPGNVYSVSFGALTTVPVDFAQGIVYRAPGLPLEGATIIGAFQIGPGIFEYRSLATTGAGGTWGPIDVATDPPDSLIVDTEYGSVNSGPPIPVPGIGYWWDPCIGARCSVVQSMYDVMASEEGVVPWDRPGGSGPPNLASIYSPGYIECDQTGEQYAITRASFGYTSDIMPGWKYSTGYVEPANPYTYTVKALDGTTIVALVLAGGALQNDLSRSWSSPAMGTLQMCCMGNIYRILTGGKIKGPAVEADRSTNIVDSTEPKEAYRLGLEFGAWEQPLDHRHDSETVEDGAGDSYVGPLCIDTHECAYCGGQVWLEPGDSVNTTYFCADCMDNTRLTDCRGGFQSRTLSTVADWQDTIARVMTSGMTLSRLVKEHYRPEEYAESDTYLVADWLGLGLDRWVAVHIVLGTLTGAAFTDGESIADAETRLERHVGPVMLKLELLHQYLGSGGTVSVAVTDVHGRIRVLTANILPGMESGDLIPLDWAPHHDYPRGYYTDVRAMTTSPNLGYVHLRVVNDGPAMHSLGGTAVTHQERTPYATDVQLSGREPYLVTEAAGFAHIAYIRDGAVMWSMKQFGEQFATPVNVTRRANWFRSCRRPCIGRIYAGGGLLVSATTQGQTRFWFSDTGGLSFRPWATLPVKYAKWLVASRTGTLHLAGIAATDDETDGDCVYYWSDTVGKTWHGPSTVAVGVVREMPPTIELHGGLIYVQTRWGTYTRTMISRDGGRTWEPAGALGA